MQNIVSQKWEKYDMQLQHVYIIWIYLPHITCRMGNYDDEVEQLEQMVHEADRENFRNGALNGDFDVEIGQRQIPTRNALVR